MKSLKTDIPSVMHLFCFWKQLAHAVGLLTRHAHDRLRHSRGTRLVMGNALVARLLYDLKDLAVDIRYQTRMTELIKAGDEIVGAILNSPTGDIAVRAKKGIVLATGGIGWSSQLPGRFFPQQAQRYSLSPISNTGTGCLAAERADGG